MHEQEAAELLGIPFDTVSQVALIPVAYTRAPTSSPGPGSTSTRCMHVDAW